MTTLHLRGIFSRYDKFGRLCITAFDREDDPNKSMKKIWALQKRNPEGRNPLTHDGFKITRDKKMTNEYLDQYIGSPVEMWVKVKNYKFRDKDTGMLMEGFSLSLEEIDHL